MAVFFVQIARNSSRRIIFFDLRALSFFEVLYGLLC